uniref:Uncharacterized protein n=1 Tax=Octopus bimaculoides TaxID=37653 RepID=A0A0L8H3X8_OCTBM
MRNNRHTTTSFKSTANSKLYHPEGTTLINTNPHQVKFVLQRKTFGFNVRKNFDQRQ